MVSPCKGCERREVGCHSGCEDYRKWRCEKDKEVEARLRERAAKPDLPIMVQRQIWKERKGK